MYIFFGSVRLLGLSRSAGTIYIACFDQPTPLIHTWRYLKSRKAFKSSLPSRSFPVQVIDRVKYISSTKPLVTEPVMKCVARILNVDGIVRTPSKSREPRQWCGDIQVWLNTMNKDIRWQRMEGEEIDESRITKLLLTRRSLWKLASDHTTNIQIFRDSRSTMTSMVSLSSMSNDAGVSVSTIRFPSYKNLQKIPMWDSSPPKSLRHAYRMLWISFPTLLAYAPCSLCSFVFRLILKKTSSPLDETTCHPAPIKRSTKSTGWPMRDCSLRTYLHIDRGGGIRFLLSLLASIILWLLLIVWHFGSMVVVDVGVFELQVHSTPIEQCAHRQLQMCFGKKGE